VGSLFDLLGQTFGDLKVVRRAERNFAKPREQAYWWCACACGNESRVRSDNLRSGRTASCGCKALGVRRNWNKDKKAVAKTTTLRKVSEP
jgi:hypothetical protein